MTVANDIRAFLKSPTGQVSKISNEQALQVELGIFFREKGYKVTFEKKILVPRINTSFKSPKSRVDLFIKKDNHKTAIELKTPLNGRHPESLFDYCKDIEFVEAIKKAGKADGGICLLLTNDQVFWEDSGRGSKIHNMFRTVKGKINGLIHKPTGPKKPHIFIEGQYFPFKLWNSFVSEKLMAKAQYLLIEI